MRLPLRPLALGLLTAFASLLSCGRDAMGPSGLSGLRSHGLAFDAQYPDALSGLGSFAGQLVAFDRVVVVIRRADGSIALTRVVEFAAGQESVTLSLDIPIAANAPPEGELVQLSLAYVNAQGDTVFRGGPSPVRALPQREGEPPPPPATVQLVYTGPGAEAVAVQIAPRTLAVRAGDRITLTAEAVTATGTPIAGTPLVFSTLDAGITLDAPTSGAASVGLVRGTARVEVRSLTGLADTATISIAPRPSALALISGGNQGATAGTPLAQPVVVQLNATDGLPITGATVTAQVTSGGGVITTVNAITDNAGRASFAWTLGASAGTQTISVSSELVTPIVVTASATLPPATRLVLRSGPTSPVTAGVSAPIVVEARRADDQLATNFSDTVTLALTTNLAGGTLLGTVRAAAVAGVATFDAWRIERAGSGYVATASATGLTSTTTAPFVVINAAANRIAVISGDSQTVVAGTVVPIAPRVRVTDVFTNAVSGLSLTLDVIEGNGVILTGTIVTDAQGEATLPSWTLGAVEGRQRVSVSAPGVTPALITVLTTAPPVALRTLVITQAPSEGLTAGAPYVPSFRAEARNDAGVVDTLFTDSVRVSLVSGPAGGVLVGTTAVAAVRGVAVLNGWWIEKAGLGYRVAVTALSANPDTTGTFDVTPALADTIVLVSGGGQSAPAGTLLATPIVVRLTDQYGNPIKEMPLAVSVTSGGGSLTEGPALLTSTLGTVTLPAWTLGAAAGAQTITVSVSGGPSLVITATATVVATATRVVITQDPAASQIAGVSGTPPLLVEVRDASNAVVTSFTDSVTIALATSPVGGALFGTTRVAAVNGVATFNAWNVRKAGAGYRVMVTAAGLVPDTTTVFTLNAAVPDTLTLVSGGGQTAYVGDTLTAPIIIRAVDAYGNPAIGAAVTFAVSAGVGTLTGAATVVDSTGQAKLGSWRMGATPMVNTITASVGALPPLTISATAIPLPPTIELAVFGSNVVGFQRAGTLQVKLLQAAPAGGLTVSVVSDHPSLLTIVAPGTVSFAAGATMGSIDVSGIAVGTATVRATAPGYTPDTLLIPVSLNLISLPTTQTVPLNQTRTIPVQLAEPAPAGGVKVAITSAAPSVVRVVTDTVSIAAGTQLGSATVEGLAIGSAAITASNPNYSPSASTVSVTAALNITQTSVALNASFGSPVTVRLESSGNTVAAPSGGIALTLTSTDPTCASVPASATIAAGVSSTSILVSYGGTPIVTSCQAYVRVAGPSGFDTDSVLAIVSAQPSITVTTTTSIGSGLQTTAAVNLGASNHGGVNVTVRSLEPSVVVISPSVSAVGEASTVFPLSVGAGSFSFYVQALEGIIADTVQVEVTAPGFRPDTMAVRVWQPVFEIWSFPTAASTLTADEAIYVRVGTPNGPAGTTFASYDAVRAGAVSPIVNFISDTPAIGTWVRTAGVADSVGVPIAPGSSLSPTSVGSGGVAYRYLTQGVGTVRAHIAGYRALAGAVRSVTVSAPSIQMTNLTVIGSGLQRNVSLNLSAPAPVGGTIVTVKQNRVGTLLLAPNSSTLGQDSLVATIPAGGTALNFTVQALDGIIADTIALTATSPGFTGVTSSVRVFQSIYEIESWVTSATTLTPDRSVYVRVGTPISPASTSFNSYDARRFGATPFRVTVVNDSIGIGTLVRTAGTTDSLDVDLAALSTVTPTSVAGGGFAYRYLAQGVGAIRARVDGLRALPGAVQAVTITAPTLSVGTLNVGSGLQRAMQVSLAQAAPTGGMPVMLRTGTAGRLLLSASNTAVGQPDSLLVTIPQGSTAINVWVQALEGIVADTVNVTATSAGVNPGVGAVRIWQPLVELTSLAASYTTLSVNDNVGARVGTPSGPTSLFFNSYDVVRPGAPSLVVTFASSNSTVGQLVTATAVGDTVRGIIRAGASTSTSVLADSGTFFDPLTVGSTVITASIPGYRAASSATVTTSVVAPAITLNTIGTIGAGLSSNRSLNLSAANHGGINVVIRSSSPSIARVAPNANTLATDSIVIFVPNGQSGVGFTVAGVEGAVGSPVISASALGFTDASIVATVVAPAIQLIGVNNTATSAATDDVFQAAIGIANGAGTVMNEYQTVRFGSPGVAVTLSNSAPGVMRLVTSALTGDTVTVTIPVGASFSPNSTAAGGAAVDYLTAGTAILRARVPGLVILPTADQTITITP